MVDYNFFAGYEVKKTKMSPGLRLVTLLFIASIIGITGYVAFNYITIAANEARLITLSLEIEQIRQTDDISRIEEKQALLTEIENTVTLLEAARDSVGTNQFLNENTLAVIIDVMPSDTTLTNYSLSGNELTISGSGANRPAVAELEKNWRAVDFVDDIFIGGLSGGEDDTISFTMNITLGGGSNED